MNAYNVFRRAPGRELVLSVLADLVVVVIVAVSTHGTRL